ncbi:hypothetical protein TcWFU_005689 [Taenia crassiceps]|uniref:Uncharacterized protein n=1 Tax=Taenia crassiceps TaxID=6207 RepID=A0ABR4Q2C4_9CEST
MQILEGIVKGAHGAAGRSLIDGKHVPNEIEVGQAILELISVQDRRGVKRFQRFLVWVAVVTSVLTWWCLLCTGVFSAPLDPCRSEASFLDRQMSVEDGGG